MFLTYRSVKTSDEAGGLSTSNFGIHPFFSWSTVDELEMSLTLSELAKEVFQIVRVGKCAGLEESSCQPSFIGINIDHNF